MTRLEFLEKSRNKHGYKYQYIDLCDKINVKDKIKIVYQGSSYTQTVEKHLMGRCPEKSVKKLNTVDFIRKSREVWGDKYDYSESEYTGSLDLIKIKLDGFVYYQRAQSHLSGNMPEYNKEDIRYSTIRVEEEYKKDIEDFLTNYSIFFEKNVRIQGLLFSFYLTKNRVIIEYYSEIHFSNNGLVLEREKRKSYCEDEYYKLIELDYNDKNILWELLYNNLNIIK